ncbi:MAG TPA: phosphoribosyltransferase family protein [Bryobacteraceae bacterium]|nr:phosphoribosyltransferase family protein [Bryobacteraceae bacterium]
MPLFADRRSAGRALARAVRAAVPETPVVLALPRGGVPVGFEVATSLKAALDVLIVRKLGMPGEEELAIGAIASGDIRVLNRELIKHLDVSEELLEEVTIRERAELERREQLYREGQQPLTVSGKTIVLVDDGLATGATMFAAAKSLLPRGVRKIIAAVPVAAKPTCDELGREVDQVVCLSTPHPFESVGQWYEDFRPTSDKEVRELLHKSAQNSKLDAQHAVHS